MVKDYSSIIVSSKVKLSRNLLGFEFPSELAGDEGIKVLNKLADNILNIDSGFKLYKMQTLPELDVNIMHEKNLITSSLMDSFGFGAVVLSEDEQVSIMLNEMDHIVETCTLSGLNLIKAYDRLNLIDNQIMSKLDIAYDDTFGFLTSSINDVGTGLKANITLFLPALTIAGKIKEIEHSLSSQGFGFTTISEEGIDSRAYTYTISNTNTIGRKETDFVVKVTEFAIRLCEMEVKARSEMLSASVVDDVKDKIYRAWGVLTNCFKLSVEEAEQFLGELKMGVALDFVRFKDVDFIENLMVDILPYSLTKLSGSTVTVSEIDKYRAKFLANVLKAKRIK
jgi:protein arginine kinase